MLHAPEASRLDQVGHAVPQAGRHHQLAEALGLLSTHQGPDVLGRGRGSGLQPHGACVPAPPTQLPRGLVEALGPELGTWQVLVSAGVE